jgi:hypothetical protein
MKARWLSPEGTLRQILSGEDEQGMPCPSWDAPIVATQLKTLRRRRKVNISARVTVPCGQ